MSDNQEQQSAETLTPQQQYLQNNQAALEEEYGEGDNAGDVAVDELDTDNGIPGDSMESEDEDDGALSADDTDDEESDTDDDGIPDDEELDGGDYEQRFKDTQAELTEKSQELAAVKADLAERIGEFTQAEFGMQDKMAEVEQTATFLHNMVNQELMQLQQVNVQQLSQEQYAQWQQAAQVAQSKSVKVNQALEYMKTQQAQAKESASNREVKVARAQLEASIDGFQEQYPKIGEYAINAGVNPRVFKDITDPGLIKLLHKAMTVESAPDTIEKVVTKRKAKKQKTRTLRGRDEKGRYSKADQAFKGAKTAGERKQAYLNRESERFKREYG